MKYIVSISLLVFFFCPIASTLADEGTAQVSEKAASDAKLERTKALLKKNIDPSNPEQAATATEAGSDDMKNSAMKMVQGLALCVGLFLVCVYFLKRYHGVTSNSGHQRLEIIEKISLSPKSSLALVRVDSRDVLIALGSEPATMLMEARPRLREKEISEEFASEFVKSLDESCETDHTISA